MNPALPREARRKLWHVLVLLYIPVVRLLKPYGLVMPVAVAFTGFVVGLEVARLNVPALEDFLDGLFGGIIRETERKRLTGTFYSVVGLFGAILLFRGRPDLFAASVLYLGLADTAAALVGVGWGSRKFAVWGNARSLEGSAAGFATALACGLGLGFSPGAAAAAAAVFTAIDVAPPPPNDNLWIPLAPALVLRLCS